MSDDHTTRSGSSAYRAAERHKHFKHIMMLTKWMVGVLGGPAAFLSGHVHWGTSIAEQCLLLSAPVCCQSAITRCWFVRYLLHQGHVRRVLNSRQLHEGDRIKGIRFKMSHCPPALNPPYQSTDKAYTGAMASTEM